MPASIVEHARELHTLLLQQQASSRYVDDDDIIEAEELFVVNGDEGVFYRKADTSDSDCEIETDGEHAKQSTGRDEDAESTLPTKRLEDALQVLLRIAGGRAKNYYYYYYYYY
eukprot:1195707-Prorocentrum_minimum.AAC.4